jgi:hypothetical protein
MARLRVPSIISRMITVIVITIISAELLKEILFPATSIGTSSLISNCASGLCCPPPCVSVANGYSPSRSVFDISDSDVSSLPPVPYRAALMFGRRDRR